MFVDLSTLNSVQSLGTVILKERKGNLKFVTTLGEKWQSLNSSLLIYSSEKSPKLNYCTNPHGKLK